MNNGKNEAGAWKDVVEDAKAKADAGKFTAADVDALAADILRALGADMEGSNLRGDEALPGGIGGPDAYSPARAALAATPVTAADAMHAASAKAWAAREGYCIEGVPLTIRQLAENALDNALRMMALGANSTGVYRWPMPASPADDRWQLSHNQASRLADALQAAGLDARVVPRGGTDRSVVQITW